MKIVKLNEDLQEGHPCYEFRGQELPVGMVVPDCDGNSIAVILKTPDGRRLSCDQDFFTMVE